MQWTDLQCVKAIRQKNKTTTTTSDFMNPDNQVQPKTQRRVINYISRTSGATCSNLPLSALLQRETVSRYPTTKESWRNLEERMTPLTQPAASVLLGSMSKHAPQKASRPLSISLLWSANCRHNWMSSLISGPLASNHWTSPTVSWCHERLVW